ncbi:two-component system sensor histidine kinase NarQ [Edwardsiella hoshinae]|uniref:Sensor protein n=1 Tax=Edwardsiella hoshinae TaxID=93378 RepID=A0A376DI49_9GAMM|nr:nitrate/nitrite two-component system sensor histidine kinase NarQ [Edwardsiella hoshinae]AOV97454.1 two-component system sensor histidine kinase NarQ [Edwardsiella hoshinae]QPR29631.1 nitrate/nitrite two-component system sensor histidine kinase NarQ [Edwardsiella hoshinae]STC89901.1 Nitrate/nitrite sensor protein narX [Edwardsiella hoshinae]
MLVKRSVTSTLARALIAMVILSVLSTGIALLTVASSINDAEAVNIAGSLRMQSYRLAYDLTNQPQDVAHHLAEYNQSLHAPALQKLTRFYVPDSVQGEYAQLLTTWQRLEIQLRQGDGQAFLHGVAHYVNQIDHFVLVLQRHAEQKMEQVLLISLIGLLALLGLVWFAIRTIRREVVAPLNKLVNASVRMQNGHFTPLHLDVNLPNEMGVLSKAFVRMSSELEKLYRSLEDKVREKTESLTQANRTLGVLFEASQALTVSQITQPSFEQVLKIVRSSEGLDYLQLEVVDSGQGRWLIASGKVVPAQASETLPLMLDGHPLGMLRWPAHQTPQRQLMQNVANMLSRGVYFNRAQKQQLQLLLMEERATIARELHDSLAQALAFLRIQITLLRRATEAENHQAQAIIQDFDRALSDAYRQLRELLATFRLTIEEADLREALQQLLAPLKLQTTAQITLHCALPSQLLNAQQQVHVLQIVREATLNAIKHAQAQHICVSCHGRADGLNVISITDDGIGLPSHEEPPGHYGLTIMTERAARLDGELHLTPGPAGGTRVTLTFRPTSGDGI